MFQKWWTQNLWDTVKLYHGWRSLVGCSPWGRYESDLTERLQFHFSLSCIGEGNGNPLQCSCLENPRDGGAWWASVYGVAQSRIRLKQLSKAISRGKYVIKQEKWNIREFITLRNWNHKISKTIMKNFKATVK